MAAPDVALPQMFCRPGMTRYRALLELVGMPCVGNRPEVMAIGADKALARAVVAAHGVTVPEGVVVGPGDPVPLTGRVVVKPVDADNSLGRHAGGGRLRRRAPSRPPCVRRAVTPSAPSSRGTSSSAARCAAACSRSTASWCACPWRSTPSTRSASRSATTPTSCGAATTGDLGLVAKDAEHAWIVDPADPVVDRPCTQAARSAYAALGCRHYGLFDFRVDPGGTPYFLEASLYCSYAPSSVLVVMAAAAGIDLERLFRLGVDAALGRPATPSVPAPVPLGGLL